MRATTLLCVTLIMTAGAAGAQTWKQYDFGNAGFGIAFPKEPNVKNCLYGAATGESVPAILYSVQQANSIFSIIVANLADTPADKPDEIDETMKVLRERGTVKLDVSGLIDHARGHQLTVAGKDGSSSAFAVYMVNHRLYLLEAKILPPNPQAGSGDAARFQQSLFFTNTAHARGNPDGGAANAPCADPG